MTWLSAKVTPEDRPPELLELHCGYFLLPELLLLLLELSVSELLLPVLLSLLEPVLP